METFVFVKVWIWIKSPSDYNLSLHTLVPQRVTLLWVRVCIYCPHWAHYIALWFPASRVTEPATPLPPTWGCPQPPHRYLPRLIFQLTLVVALPPPTFSTSTGPQLCRQAATAASAAHAHSAEEHPPLGNAAVGRTPHNTKGGVYNPPPQINYFWSAFVPFFPLLRKNMALKFRMWRCWAHLHTAQTDQWEASCPKNWITFSPCTTTVSHCQSVSSWHISLATLWISCKK